MFHQDHCNPTMVRSYHAAKALITVQLYMEQLHTIAKWTFTNRNNSREARTLRGQPSRAEHSTCRLLLQHCHTLVQSQNIWACLRKLAFEDS
uniref:Uncharacterized protein n=1 Tax=Onchocerca volvulus TaxID=6282 RepID=A0A8R1Y2C3_ONCVO